MENNYISKDKMQTLITGLKVKKEDGMSFLEGLAEKGYTIEGYNDGSKGSINEKKPNLLQKAGNFARDVVGSTVQNFETVGKTVGGLAGAGGIYLGRKILGEDDQSFKEVYKDYVAGRPQESLSGMISPRTPSETQDITTLEGVKKTAGALGQGIIDVATLGAGSGIVKGGVKSLVTESAKIGAGVGATEAMKQGGDLQDVATGGLTGGVLGGALGAGIAGVKAVTPIIRRTIQAIPEIKVKTPSISKIFEDVKTKSQAILTPDKLKKAQSLGIDIKGIDKDVFNTGVRQGIEIDDVYNLTKLSKKDAEIGLEVLDAAKKFTVDKTGKVPVDIIGENIANKLKPVANIIKEVGKGVDDAAKSLKGKVNTNRQELVNTFDNILAEYDITGFPGNWNFQDSRFRLSPTLQNKLSSTLDNAYAEIKGKVTKGTGKTPIIDGLNPTGGVFVDYTPQARMTAKLADNITTLDKTMGKSPDEMIMIYRGAPKNQKSIVGGDFVTTNYDLAKAYSGNGNVLSKKVKLSDVLDDIGEPLGEEYIYRPKSQLVDTRKAELADDYVLHTLKKAIDDVVDYGKRSTEGLSVNAENLLKSIRRSIDVELDKSYPSYSAINEKFSQLMDFKDDIQGLLKIDIFDIKTGKTKNAIRGAFSNRNTNTELRDLFLNLDDNLKSIGVKITEDESIARQFLFNELIEKILGRQAITSLQAEVGKAVGAVSTARKAITQPLSATLDIVGKGAEKLLGQSEKAKIEFIEKVLKNTLK